MIKAVVDYFTQLAKAFGHGWTSFWFTPSDPATLSAIRLLTGLVVVYLHGTLAFDLVALFGPDGLLPAAEIAPLDAGSFSYLNYLHSPAELWAGYLIGLAVLVLFAAGYWTRLMTILALIVFLSDVHRAPMITSRSESLCAMLMLYLCIGPCGARYSLDSWFARLRSPLVGEGAEVRGRRAESSLLIQSPSQLSTTATIAIRLIQIHLALLVAMMGFSKLSGEVWWTGEGVWWLIARPESRLFDLTWLYEYPKLIAAWTHAIVLFELSFPLLIWVRLARPLLLAAGVLIWSSLALVTGEITFAIMMMIASLAFVSPEVLLSYCNSRGSAAGTKG